MRGRDDSDAVLSVVQAAEDHLSTGRQEGATHCSAREGKAGVGEHDAG